MKNTNNNLLSRSISIVFIVMIIVMVVRNELFANCSSTSNTNNDSLIITNNNNNNNDINQNNNNKANSENTSTEQVNNNIVKTNQASLVHFFGECVSIEENLSTSQEFVYRINGSRSNLYISIPNNSLLSGSLCLELVQKYKPYNEEILPIPPTLQTLHPLTLFRINLTLVNINSSEDVNSDFVYNRTMINFGLVSDIPPTYPLDPYSLRVFVMNVNGKRFEFPDGGKDEPTDRYEFFIPLAFRVKTKLMGVFAFNGELDSDFGYFIPITYPMKVRFKPVNEIKNMVVGYSTSNFYPPSTPFQNIPNMNVDVIQEIFSPIQLNLVPLARYSFQTSTFFPNMTSIAHVFQFKTKSDYFVTQEHKLVEIDRRSLHCLYIYNQKVIAKEGIYTKTGGVPRLICKPVLKNDIQAFELLILARIKNPPHPSDDIKIHVLRNNIQHLARLPENSKVTFKYTVAGRSEVRIDTVLDKVNDPFFPPPTFYFGMGYAPTNVDFDTQIIGQSFKYFSNEYDIPVDLFIIAYSPSDHMITITPKERLLPPLPNPIDSHSSLRSAEDDLELTILVVSASVLLFAVVIVCLGTIIGVACIMKKKDRSDEMISLLGKGNKI